MFVEGSLDILDHACPILGHGSKVGIDATRKWRAEFERDKQAGNERRCQEGGVARWQSMA